MVVKFDYWKGFPCFNPYNNPCILKSTFSDLFKSFYFQIIFFFYLCFFLYYFIEICVKEKWNFIQIDGEVFFASIFFFRCILKPCLVFCKYTFYCTVNGFSYLNSTLSIYCLCWMIRVTIWVSLCANWIAYTFFSEWDETHQ